MEDESAQALNLTWVYGLSDVPSNSVNLSGDDNADLRIAYVAAHTAVVYDKHAGTQKLLQGHCNAITCMQATADRSPLITADAGLIDSLLVFWDPETGQPLTTVQRPHAAGVLAMAVSADGQHLATLSAPAHSSSGDLQQEISVWDISTVASSSPPSQLQPLSTTAVPAGDTQTCLAYHQQDAAQLVTNGPSRVFFWTQQQQHHPAGQPLSFFSPAIKPAEFQQAVGDFVASVFVPGSTQALTSTVDGDVIVWEQDSASVPLTAGPAQASNNTAWRPLKVIRLHGAAIRHLSSIGDFVVTGGADGLVRLFDAGMRLCAWFEQLDAGPVNCVSFATKGQQQPTAAMQLSSLSAPNFTVSTSSGKVLVVQADSFNSPLPDNPSGCELLIEAPDSCLTHLLAHPLRPELLLLSTPGSLGKGAAACSSSKTASGPAGKQQAQGQAQKLVPTQRLQRWDLVSRGCVVSRQLPPEQLALQVALARDGAFAVLGCGAGHVTILKGETLQELASLRHTKHDITRVNVSTDGRFVACADAVGQVLLYGFLPHKGAYFKWDLVGKFKAHHGDVVGLHFGEARGGQTRLFSLGADRRLIEFDLSTCTAANTGLRARSIRDSVPPGSTGSPCAMCFAPPMPYYSHSSTETLLLVADDAYKIKAYNPDAESALATATFLGPTFGEPINHLLPFSSVSDEAVTPWLAYSTAERVVGLIKWPLDCEPRSSMGLIAHPGPVKGLVLSYDGRKLITLGTGGIMNVWAVNTAALLPPAPAAAPAGLPALSSSSSRPDWEQLVADPTLYEELRDYFCYAQLTTQPLDATDSFAISGHVPVAALPDVMRAAGHYPSEADTDSLLAHVRFLADMAPADDTLMCSTSGAEDGHDGAQPQAASAAALAASAGVDLDTFLLLYLSHRSVADISRQQVEAAFRTLGATTAAGVLSSAQLLEMLQTGGEPMGAEELQQVLAALTGCGNPEAALPEWLDAGTFMTEVLGFA